MRWKSDITLIDTDTNNQIGECWRVEVEADSVEGALSTIREKAWEEVDTRLNDVSIEILAIWPSVDEDDVNG